MRFRSTSSAAAAAALSAGAAAGRLRGGQGRRGAASPWSPRTAPTSRSRSSGPTPNCRSRSAPRAAARSSTATWTPHPRLRRHRRAARGRGPWRGPDRRTTRCRSRHPHAARRSTSRPAAPCRRHRPLGHRWSWNSGCERLDDRRRGRARRHPQVRRGLGAHGRLGPPGRPTVSGARHDPRHPRAQGVDAAALRRRQREESTAPTARWRPTSPASARSTSRGRARQHGARLGLGHRLGGLRRRGAGPRRLDLGPRLRRSSRSPATVQKSVSGGGSVSVGNRPS